MILVLAVGMVACTMFVLNEAFLATDPVVPFRLLITNDIGIACLTQVLIMIPQSGVIILR